MPSPVVARLALLSLVLVLSACSLGGPDPIGITGRWEGTVTSVQTPSQVFDITLRLTDDGRSVIGTGEVALPGDRFVFNVLEGSFLQGQVYLPMRFDRPPFEGTISGRLTRTDPGEITGTISGSGLANGPLKIELKAR